MNEYFSFSPAVIITEILANSGMTPEEIDEASILFPLIYSTFCSDEMREREIRNAFTYSLIRIYQAPTYLDGYQTSYL